MHYAPIARTDSNPFAPATGTDNAVLFPAFDQSLHRVIRRIVRSERLVPVMGAPGTGKTLLLAEIERRLGGRANVRRLAGGDMLNPADLPDVLLVDEGERADPRVLERVLAGGWSGTMVLACARDCLGGLPASWRARPETLRTLRPREARAFARARLKRGGNQGLIARDALSTLARASGGNVRALVQIGGTAVFLARSEGADIVTAAHVRGAIEMRRALDGAGPSAPIRRSRRQLASVTRVAAVLRRNRTEAMAGAGAAFALVLLMLGGAGDRRPVGPASLASAAPVPSPATQSLAATPLASHEAQASGSPTTDRALLQSTAPAPHVLRAKLNTSAESPVQLVASTLRETSAPEEQRARTPGPADPLSARTPAIAPPKTGALPTSPVLALTRPTEAPAAPSTLSEGPAAARGLPPATLAMAIPAGIPPAAGHLALVDDPAAGEAERTRRAAIAARDALREMRAGRGG